MTAFDLDGVVLALSTSGAAFLMVLLGVQKTALEWRRRRRFCPSCGRLITGRTCSGH